MSLVQQPSRLVSQVDRNAQVHDYTDCITMLETAKMKCEVLPDKLAIKA